MDSAKQQLIDKLKTANKVLVSVSRNPSVDQLSALLGFSLIMNKLGKHCTAIFSGQVPSTIEFLKPEETIEKTTDSLRDFIIALDKNKADKLRYKVEDNVVRIFITPYRTSITQADLEFSQGDFNVDIVIAIGVSEQSELDEAITAHGRILHDAVVASINTTITSDIGVINWKKPESSSLCELICELAQGLGPNILDEQIATALLTGIVSETDRFSNDKTTPQTMSLSATLMSAGANQQLIANKLKEGLTFPAAEDSGNVRTNTADGDGTLEINHDAQVKDEGDVDKKNDSQITNEANKSPSIIVDKKDGRNTSDWLNDGVSDNTDSTTHNNLSPGAKLIMEPPKMGGTLTANAFNNEIEPITDPLSMPLEESPQIFTKKEGAFLSGKAAPTLEEIEAKASSTSIVAPIAPPVDVLPTPINSSINAIQASPTAETTYTQPPISWNPDNAEHKVESTDSQVHIDNEGTLTQLEESVNSPHVELKNGITNENAAREEVDKALGVQPLTVTNPANNAVLPTSDSPPPVPPPIAPPPTPL